MTEQQLKDLIVEVREKIQEYSRKLQGLETEKERMLTAQQTLKKDIDTLNNLRVELAASVASLKTERDALLKARIEVEKVEKVNLMAIASAYDKMDAARAGDILKSMAQGQTAGSPAARMPMPMTPSRSFTLCRNGPKPKSWPRWPRPSPRWRPRCVRGSSR